MEEFGVPHFNGIKRKRSQISRRPKPDSDALDHSTLSATPPSDDVRPGSSDENSGANSRRKSERLYTLNDEDGGVNGPYRNGSTRNAPSKKRSSEGVLAPANWKSSNKSKESTNSGLRSAYLYDERNSENQGSYQPGAVLDTIGNENKVKKVKLKVGGITRTIHADTVTSGISSAMSSRSVGASRSSHNLNLQRDIEEEQSVPDKRTNLQAIPRKSSPRSSFNIRRDDSSAGKISGKKTSVKQGDKSEQLRKSKRVVKRRVLDGASSEDDDDGELRYLEKLKFKGTLGYRENDEESNKKRRRLCTIGSDGALRPVKDGKNSRSDRVSEDSDYQEEELVSDGELKGIRKKNQKKESFDSSMEGKREMGLTTRQRALQSSKDGPSAPGVNLIEFPNGLPPAPSRKQKEKLTEVEQQLKKAEAAQRRRMQVEKAARESEQEAIRKILGQDSNRKKKEEKMKKRQQELAQERAANALKHASNTVRWISGPAGNIVTFPEEMALPSIFNLKPRSYPLPRERCAGPYCSNPFKYRHSKTMLPICSLECYRAVQEETKS